MAVSANYLELGRWIAEVERSYCHRWAAAVSQQEKPSREHASRALASHSARGASTEVCCSTSTLVMHMRLPRKLLPIFPIGFSRDSASAPEATRKHLHAKVG